MFVKFGSSSEKLRYRLDGASDGVGWTASQNEKMLRSGCFPAREARETAANVRGAVAEGSRCHAAGSMALLGPVLRGRPRPRETAAGVRRFHSMGKITLTGCSKTRAAATVNPRGGVATASGPTGHADSLLYPWGTAAKCLGRYCSSERIGGELRRLIRGEEWRQLAGLLAMLTPCSTPGGPVPSVWEKVL